MRAALLALVLLSAACEYYDRPNRPVPRDFRAVTLGGKVVDRAKMRGQPWVIGLWVPT